MKRATSYRILTVAFYVAVALSVVLLVPSTLNYNELYVALGHMHLRINSFNIYSTPDGGGAVGANLSIVQNSSYVGLSVLSVDISAYFNAEEGYQSSLFSKKFSERDASIGPYSTLNLIMANQTYLDNYQLFADYNNQCSARGEPVRVLFVSDINLFLLGSPSAETVNLDNVVYQMPNYVS